MILRIDHVFTPWRRDGGKLRLTGDNLPKHLIAGRGTVLVPDAVDEEAHSLNGRVTLALFRLIEDHTNLRWLLLSPSASNFARLLVISWLQKMPANVMLLTTEAREERKEVTVRGTKIWIVDPAEIKMGKDGKYCL